MNSRVTTSKSSKGSSKQTPELDHDSFLGGREHGAQLVRAVRAVAMLARWCHLRAVATVML